MSDAAFSSLVIDTRKLLSMGMDGPALKVVMRGCSPVLFPLRRLRRIHILGTPGSGMEALLFCAEQQIPVAFFKSNGRLRCRLNPAAGTPALIDHWFEHVEFDPQIGQLYDDWVLHQGLHAMSRLGINAGACESRKKLVYETLRGFCRQKLGRGNLKAALEWLDGLLCFHLEQVIEEFGFVQQRGRLKLLGDMKPICDLWLLHALAGSLQQRASFNVTAQSMTAFYQQQADQLEFASRRMLTQLVNRLEAVV
ncbi:MAG: CRISPR-associated endonuclease Cas1 [Pseudohongiellaceae bacterium]